MPGVVQEVTLDTLPAVGRELARAAASGDWSRELRVCAGIARGDMKERFETATDPEGRPWPALRFPRPRGGDRPLRDRGLLMASVSARGATHVERVAADSLEIGTNDQRAWTHQAGATIEPKNGKMLAIPLTREAVRFSGPKSGPNPWPASKPLRLIPSGTGHPLLVEEQVKGKGKQTKTVAHYVLVPRVKIPPRPFVGLSEKGQEACAAAIADGMERRLG